MSARDLAFLMFINVVWGFAMIAAASSLKHFPPLEFTALRFFLISVLLVYFVSPWWLLFTAFIGLNLLQASFTGFCPAAMIFKRLGVRGGGCAFQ